MTLVLSILIYGLVYHIFTWNVIKHFNSLTDVHKESLTGDQVLGCTLSLIYLVCLIILLLTPLIWGVIVLLGLAVLTGPSIQRATGRYNELVKISQTKAQEVINRSRKYYNKVKLLTILIWLVMIIVYIVVL